MEDTLDKRIYELAYHLTPDLGENELVPQMQKVEEIITQLGGSIVTSKDPQKKHLSYPINHKHYAYFGYIDFNATQDTINSLNDQLKLTDSVMRYLVINKEDMGRELSVYVDKDKKSKSQAKKAATSQGAGKVEKKEQTPEQKKQMEEDIEGVLEKL